MSTAQRDALRERVDATIGAYVEAVSEAIEQPLTATVKSLEQRIVQLEIKVLEQQTNLDNLISSASLPADTDKYSLTKAKMIKLMKQMGYYD